MKKNSDHPEVIEIKNICDVTPKSKTTKTVCSKVNKDKQSTAPQKPRNSNK